MHRGEMVNLDPRGCSRLTLAVLSLLMGAVILPATLGQTAQKAAPKTSAAAEHFISRQLGVNGKADLSSLPGKDRTISHQFLEQLILSAHPSTAVAPLGVAISNATIIGQFSINNATIPFFLSLDHCRFPDGFDLSSDTFSRDIAFNANTVGAPSTNAPANFIGDTFSGSVSIDDSYFYNGLDFTNSSIAGSLSSSNVHYESEDDEADFDSVKIRAQAFFRKSHFAGGLDLSDAQLFFLDIEDPLPLPNSSSGVPGSMSLDLNQAAIGHGLEIENVGLSLLQASFLDVKGSTEIANTAPLGRVDLKHSHFQDLTIRGIDAWMQSQEIQNFHLDGLSFDWVEIPEPKSKVQPTAVRLRDLINKCRYSPQPYLQLEAFLRANASFSEADNTYFDMRGREREALPWYQGMIDWLLYVSVGYGRRPLRAGIPLFVLYVIGVGLFWSKEKMEHDDDSTDNWYNPYWYSLDLLSPIDLGVSKRWRAKGAILRNYAQVHRVAGWILVPLIAAAITGIIK